MKRRHKLFYKIFRPLAKIYLKLKFSYKYKTHKKEKPLPENYIVLSNHATDYDPVLLGVAFKRQMYFVGSEHITRFGKIYKFLNYCFAPIVRAKGTLAVSTVVEIMRKTKHGGNVCIFAEGIRTWDGVSSPIHPTTARLVKNAGCGLVTFRLSGGYFSSPMWADSSNTRKGALRGEVVRCFTKEELKQMSEEEIFKVISEDLYENAYERQKSEMVRYKGKKLAAGLERFMIKCPSCSAEDTISSEKNSVSCSSCKKTFSYNEYGYLTDAPFETLLEYSEWQKKELITEVLNGTAKASGRGMLSIIDKHESRFVLEGDLSFDGKVIKIGDKEMLASGIAELSMHGNKFLCFVYEGVYYDLKVLSGSVALKYSLLFNMYKSQKAEV